MVAKLSDLQCNGVLLEYAYQKSNTNKKTILDVLLASVHKTQGVLTVHVQ